MHFKPATHPDGRPINERLTLFVLAAVQFTHTLDFMIIQPLGSRLMQVFHCTPGEFTRLVAVYGIAAAVAGFVAGFFLDRVNRKHALLTLYAGFTLATLACALAPNYWALMAARCLAGAFGGVAGSVVVAMVGDIISPERRGKAMSIVTTAFPLASIFGIPLGLKLTDMFEWHATFYVLVILGVIVFCIGAKALPSISPFAHGVKPWDQMKAIFAERVHRRGFVLSIALVFGGACVIPLMAPTMVRNVGITEENLFLVYLCGGALTFVTMPLIGKWTDRYNKVMLIGIFCGITACVVNVVTNLPPSPLWIALVCSTLFMASMSSRFGPTMALLANAVEPRFRGGFMSVNAAVQQAAGGLATMSAGLFVTSETETGPLHGYPYVGIMSAVCLALTYYLARRVYAIAPWAAKPGAHSPMVSGPGSLANRLASVGSEGDVHS